VHTRRDDFVELHQGSNLYFTEHSIEYVYRTMMVFK